MKLTCVKTKDLSVHMGVCVCLESVLVIFRLPLQICSPPFSALWSVLRAWLCHQWALLPWGPLLAPSNREHWAEIGGKEEREPKVFSTPPGDNSGLVVGIYGCLFNSQIWASSWRWSLWITGPAELGLCIWWFFPQAFSRGILAIYQGDCPSK